MRRPPPAPGGTGLAERLALSSRSSDGTASALARFLAMHPGQPPSRLRPRGGWAPRSDNTAGGAAARQPKGRKGLGATCFVPAPRKGGHPVVVAAPRILGSDPGRALGALLPGPKRIREGATTPCREHGEERQQRRRPAQGQPGGPPRLGRPALLGLVVDDTTSPPRPASRCIPRRGRRARDPPSGPTPTPKPLARGPRGFLNSLLRSVR
jgi:hypothetical protein